MINFQIYYIILIIIIIYYFYNSKKKKYNYEYNATDDAMTLATYKMSNEDRDSLNIALRRPRRPRTPNKI